MVEVAGIGVLRRPILGHGHRAEDAPRPGPEEALPRHRREGFDNRARTQLGREPQFFCVALPCLLDQMMHLLLLGYVVALPIAIFAAKSARTEPSVTARVNLNAGAFFVSAAVGE